MEIFYGKLELKENITNKRYNYKGDRILSFYKNNEKSWYTSFYCLSECLHTFEPNMFCLRLEETVKKQECICKLIPF